MIQGQQFVCDEVRIQGRYAFQPVNVNAVLFLGEIENHILLYTDAVWQCDCDVYALNTEKNERGFCCHTLALEQSLVAAIC